MALAKEVYEQLANDVFSGLKMYARDVNLTKKQFSQYRPGQIIMERGFTDATYRFMGMTTTHRISILSNHMAELGNLAQVREWGLSIARDGAHFKVMDIYEYRGKTQILLLHLPHDYRWRYFQTTIFSIEEELIQDARRRFEKKAFAKVIPELSGRDWLGRCEAPLGMSDDGELFALEKPLAEQKEKVKETTFRAFYHQFVYVDCRKILCQIMPEAVEKDDAGLVLYGYIDEDEGLSFQAVAIAKETTYGLETRPVNEERMYILRVGALVKCKYCPIEEIEMDRSGFAEFENRIRRAYDTKNEEKERSREDRDLDSFRHPFYPDDMAVLLLHEKKSVERVWVRLTAYTEDEMEGELLNEPISEFGIHRGDRISFFAYRPDREEEEYYLVSPH